MLYHQDVCTFLVPFLGVWIMNPAQPVTGSTFMVLAVSLLAQLCER